MLRRANTAAVAANDLLQRNPVSKCGIALARRMMNPTPERENLSPIACVIWLLEVANDRCPAPIKTN